MSQATPANIRKMSIIRHLRESTTQYAFFVAFLVVLQLGSTYIQTALTAFVQAEGLWSKAQKDASRSLSLYVVTEQPSDLRHFLRCLQTIHHFERARLELIKPSPNYDESDKHFIAAGVDPMDVRKMAYVVHYGDFISHIANALAIWKSGDEEIALMENLAKEIRDQTDAGPLDLQIRKHYLARIIEINDRLAREELAFSTQLRLLAGLLGDMVYVLYGLIALLSVGYALFVYRRSENFVGAIGGLVDAIESMSQSGDDNQIERHEWRELSVIADAFNGFVLLRSRHEATRLELANLENLVNTLNDTAIISMTDESGKIIHANDKFCEVSGFSHEELIGKDHRTVNSGFHPKEFFAELWRTIKRGEMWSGEVCNRRKDGSVYWVDSTIKPVQGPGGRTQYLSIRYDITARKQMQESLIQNAKLTSLGEMAASVAHEINNPMVIINGYARQLRNLVTNSVVDPVILAKKLEAILNAGERVASIVKELLNFSRDGTHDPAAPESLRPLVDVAVDLCRSQIDRHGIDLQYGHFDDAVCEVRGVQISQIIFNLLNNACDAMELYDGPRWIRIESAVAQGRVRITVADAGKGIPREIAERIMQPFFTTKPVGRGTGLGLSVSRGIAESHHGSLKLDLSSPNTCFVLELPLYAKDEQAADEKAA